MKKVVAHPYIARSTIKSIPLYLSDDQPSLELTVDVPFSPAGYQWNKNMFLSSPGARPASVVKPYNQNDQTTNTLNILVELIDLHGNTVATSRVQTQSKMVRTVQNPNLSTYTSLVTCTTGPFVLTQTSTKPKRFFKIKVAGNRSGWPYMTMNLHYIDRSLNFYAFT